MNDSNNGTSTGGLAYWRSLEELAETPRVAELLTQEFSGYDPKQVVSLPRRRFMKLMAASMALAGVTASGCRRWPKENIAPHTSRPRGTMPGVAEHFATIYQRGGIGDALVVTSYDGRPIKIEGNNMHPGFATFDGKLGTSDIYAQASILEMYDPDRSRGVIESPGENAKANSWDAAIDALRSAAQAGGFAVLSEAHSGAAVEQLKAALPNVAFYEYEAISMGNRGRATQAVFGRPLRPVAHLDKAKVIVSLDGDLFGSDPAHLTLARDWAKGRRTADTDGTMNRLYIAESQFSNTAAVADHRLPIKPSRLAQIAQALLLGVPGDEVAESSRIALTDAERKFVHAAIADLKAAGSAGLVYAGPETPVDVQSTAIAINAALGAAGTAITYHDLPVVDHVSQITELARRIKAGEITGLLILGGNPAFDAPAELGFADLIKGLATSAHLSIYVDETSKRCKWHLGRSHTLESWDDARSFDGTRSIQQPLIVPLFDTRSLPQVLSLLGGNDRPEGEKLVKDAWQKLVGQANFDTAWKTALHDGLVQDSAAPAVQVVANTSAAAELPAAKGGRFELRFQVNKNVYDGRYANNGWLQEMPETITKLVWDNAAIFSVDDAKELGLTINPYEASRVKLTVDGRSVEMAAFVQPGQPKGVVGVSLGYGRTSAGNIGTGLGFDVYPLRTSANQFAAYDLQVEKISGSYPLVCTVEHSMVDLVAAEIRDKRIGGPGKSAAIVREATLEEYKRNPTFVEDAVHKLPLLQLFDAPYKNPPARPGAPAAFNKPHAWGMSIDMATCVGCNACIMACNSENNIPIVGKEMVHFNREMHWLRIDRYFKGDTTNPEVVYQPMTCQHCENAPCEQVCPVAATVHDTEGLNTMVYNRCIGTRYCSNNCPYKVRRFNYYDWHSRKPRNTRYNYDHVWAFAPDSQQKYSVDAVTQMRHNPEVTVRMRGVMEKCTYCTQRIKAATIDKKNKWSRGEEAQTMPDGRPGYVVDDFDVVTACQQACPTQAIVFGDLNDAKSMVSVNQKSDRSYAVLADLNTRPRTRYLAKVFNPNPQLASSEPVGGTPEHH